MRMRTAQLLHSGCVPEKDMNERPIPKQKSFHVDTARMAFYSTGRQHPVGVVSQPFSICKAPLTLHFDTVADPIWEDHL